MFRHLPTNYARLKWTHFGDVLIVLLIALFIFGSISLAERWVIDFQPSITIDLSMSSLPLYAILSLFRALIAYGLSLAFTLTMGYWAARSRTAESIILPLLDIGQSIPVLGFLPSLVLGLIALFPRTNLGLELACILMIFTGQVWNMTFSFYSSMKAVPVNFIELSHNVRFSARQRFFNIELPYSASSLAWNSLMSMAGGWFFLTVCEAFTLGDRQFRLYGLGSYMAVAIEKGNTRAMFAGFIAMVMIIMFMDFVIWRPVVAWTRRFRLDEQQDQAREIPFFQILLKDSVLVEKIARIAQFVTQRWHQHLSVGERRRSHSIRKKRLHPTLRKLTRFKSIIAWTSLSLFGLWLITKIVNLLSLLSLTEGFTILGSAGLTLLRVIFALIVSTLWAVPFGVWVGLSPARTRFFQPMIQIAASFPAPMLYPLVLFVLTALHIQLGIGAGILMLLGVQWYVLFNVLAGATVISRELRDTFQLINASRRRQWLDLYLPSILPNLVTGWVTAAGGAWNASIVAEYMNYKGQTLKTHGLGALISNATTTGNYPLLAGSLVTMVIIVIGLNRSFWKKLYAICENRYRFER